MPKTNEDQANRRNSGAFPGFPFHSKWPILVGCLYKIPRHAPFVPRSGLAVIFSDNREHPRTEQEYYIICMGKHTTIPFILCKSLSDRRWDPLTRGNPRCIISGIRISSIADPAAGFSCTSLQ